MVKERTKFFFEQIPACPVQDAAARRVARRRALDLEVKTCDMHYVDTKEGASNIHRLVRKERRRNV
jgi:hypothetical protein